MNALLNMDEKGDDALGMDDTTDIDNVGEEENENRETSGHDVQKSLAAIADKPVQRTSLKEKLEAFKVKAAGTDRTDIGKTKGKEESLL